MSRLIFTSIVALTAILGMATSPSANAKGEVKQGVSKKSAELLRKTADHNAVRDLTIQQKSREASLKALQSALKVDRQALDVAMTKQPNYASYKKALDGILAVKPRDMKQAQSRSLAIAQLNKKYEPMFKKAWSDAGLSERSIVEKVAKCFHFKPCCRIKIGPFGIPLIDCSECQPVDEPAEELSFCAQPPYDTRATSNNSHLIAGTFEQSASANSGNFRLKGLTLYGGLGTNRAVVGDYVTVPAGYTRLKVRAKIRMNHHLRAIGLLGGVGYAQADLRLELTGTNGSSQSHNHMAGLAVAPLMWVNIVNGDDTYFIEKTFTIPSGGGEYLVRAGGTTMFGSLLIGGSRAEETGNVEEICIEALP